MNIDWYQQLAKVLDTPPMFTNILFHEIHETKLTEERR